MYEMQLNNESDKLVSEDQPKILAQTFLHSLVNGIWTAFIQHFSNQWPLKALYNSA